MQSYQGTGELGKGKAGRRMQNVRMEPWSGFLSAPWILMCPVKFMTGSRGWLLVPDVPQLFIVFAHSEAVNAAGIPRNAARVIQRLTAQILPAAPCAALPPFVQQVPAVDHKDIEPIHRPGCDSGGVLKPSAHFSPACPITSVPRILPYLTIGFALGEAINNVGDP